MSDTQLNAAEPLVEALTRREREILGLLSDGLSAPEIARRLTLALSSVKWYIQQIYTKLGVNRRQQALLRARALGLLAAPAAPPGAAPQHNLPLELTRFFGRETEIAQIKELLAEYRLVTITGAGGVGKTRLALRVAEAVLDDFANGVWFVELAALSDPALVAQTVAVTLGVRADPGRPILDSLIAHLRSRQVLLVLDNCEHLLAACARLAETLLRACPRLTLLATSREPLGSAGESVLAAPSLPFPEPGQPISLESLTTFPSVRLFADRARMVLPDYQLTPAGAAPLARICQRLDGVPLAIEMAAARMNLLTAEQLAARLDDAFRVLAGGQRTALPRQQTLRATLDWSYALLSEEERLLLQRLSVFAGGCTLEAAEAVCSGEGLEPGRVVDVLGSLVAKSMVLGDRRQDEDTRYRLLEMVRQYGQEKLKAAGEDERLRRRHRDYFGNLLEALVPQRRVKVQHTEVGAEALIPETDNLRLALEWSFADPTDIEAGPRLVMAIQARWPTLQEYLSWYRRALVFAEGHPELDPEMVARLLGWAGGAVTMNDPAAGLALTLRAVELSRQLGLAGREVLMRSLYLAGNTYLMTFRDGDRAIAPIAEADALFEALGLANGYTPAELGLNRAWRSFLQAEIAQYQGRFEQARRLADESVWLYAEHGAPDQAFKAHISLGGACLGLGEWAEARAQFLAALRLRENARIYDTLREKSYALRWLALADLGAGELKRGLGYCHDSLRIASAIPDHNITASGLGLAALFSAAQGQAVLAATLSGASAAMWKRQGRQPWEDSSLETLLPAWQSRPDQAAIGAAYSAGQALDAEQAVAYALDEPRS